MSDAVLVRDPPAQNLPASRRAATQTVCVLARGRYSRLMGSRSGYLYILASKRNGTLYIGVTGDLAGRIWEHRNGTIPGFTRRYGVKTLVWYEYFDDINDAIDEEKRLRRWRRAWKVNLIQERNPDWRDLYDEIGPF